MASEHLVYDSSESDSDFAAFEEQTATEVEQEEGEEEPIRPPSPSLVELESSEHPRYFVERDERLFPSHGDLLYPLPVDTPEHQRLNAQHKILNRMIGANYFGPVGEVLAPDPSRSKNVVDLCTGTGKWAMEMAREFPHVMFMGLDIVPIAEKYPLRNVQFELHDVNKTLRWNEGTIDLVHARGITMATRDFPAVIEEAARILRPGGLLLSCEWMRHAAFDLENPRNPSDEAPHSTLFFRYISQALLNRRGIRPIAQQIPSMILDNKKFTNVNRRIVPVPIGDWHPDPAMQTIGRAFRLAHKRYASSLKPLLIEDGRSEAQVNVIIRNYLQELRNTRGLISICQMVHATRLQ